MEGCDVELPNYLTFDCYGTLVDFDLDSVTLEHLGGRLEGVDTPRFLREFEQIRFEEVLGEYRPYRAVLRESLKRAMTQFGLEYRTEDGDALVAAVPTFGPFPDVPPVLEHLRQHCKLVIISNTEDDLIDHNVRNIGVPFDHVITAEQARAYKPALESCMWPRASTTTSCRPPSWAGSGSGSTGAASPATRPSDPTTSCPT